MSLSLSTSTKLKTVADFYHEVDRLLDSPLEIPEAFKADGELDEETKIHAAVFDKFQNFLALLEACYDKFLDQQYNLDYCIARLLDSSFVHSHHGEVSSCILDLLGRATSLPVLLVTYDLLLAWGQTEPSVYRTVHNGVSGLAIDKITRLVHQIWAGHYAAVADARLGGGIASDNTKHWYARTNGRRESVTPHLDGFTDWNAGGQSEAGEDSNAFRGERQEGHPVLRHLISQVAETSNAARTRIHQIRLRDKAIQILYEVCRVQRLEPSDMRAVDEKFVNHLFDLVEETRLHEDEAFNYLLIKLIVALNEQFMVNSIALKGSMETSKGNIVLSILKSRLHVTKTFGENLIFMLNRASSSSAEDFCMQLLVLKLLYLLFTNKETAHYFYTNDLRVLVDVFIRELSDLPEESESLRHTYLRVLHPLLTNTQLCSWPYKRPQIRRLLHGMVKDSLYRGTVSPTTRRLVQRCLDAEWCIELDRLDPDHKAAASGSEKRSTAVGNSDGSSIALVQSVGGREPAKLKTVGVELTPEGLPSQIVAQSPIEVASASSVAMTVRTPKSSEGDGEGVRTPRSAPQALASSQILPRQTPASAPAPTPAAATTAPSPLLSAPRFRGVFSARSAPSSPPPRLNEEGAAVQATAFTSHSDAGEAEAMAFADAHTRRQSTLEPSWQSQIASHSAEWSRDHGDDDEEKEDETLEGEVLTIPSGPVIVASQLLAAPPQRPIARRASHGEVRPSSTETVRSFATPTPTTGSSTSASRRPPPAPPEMPTRRREGLPASSSEAEHGSTLQYLSASGSLAPSSLSAPPHGDGKVHTLPYLSHEYARLTSDTRTAPALQSKTWSIPQRQSSYDPPTIDTTLVDNTYGSHLLSHKGRRGEVEGNDQAEWTYPHLQATSGDHFEDGDGYIPAFTSPLSSTDSKNEREKRWERQDRPSSSLSQSLGSLTIDNGGVGAGGDSSNTVTRSSTPASTSGSTSTTRGGRRRAPPAPPGPPAAPSAVTIVCNEAQTAAEQDAAGPDLDAVEDGHRDSLHPQHGTVCQPPGRGGGEHRRFYTRSRVSSDVGQHLSSSGDVHESDTEDRGQAAEDSMTGHGTYSDGEQHTPSPSRLQVNLHIGSGGSGHSKNLLCKTSLVRSTASVGPTAAAETAAGAGGGQRRRPPPPPVDRSTKGGGLAFRA